MFSGEMVCAMLEGRKTQTRRRMKAIPPAGAVGAIRSPDGKFNWHNDKGFFVGEPFPCAYGATGDFLYVREDYRVSSFYDRMAPSSFPQNDMLRIYYEADKKPLENFGKKREAMFLPRWMSRITLELLEVRVEKLHAISDEDCFAEGINMDDYAKGKSEPRTLRGGTPARYSYALLWDRVNGDGSWQINPFVWVLVFEVRLQNIDELLAERAEA